MGTASERQGGEEEEKYCKVLQTAVCMGVVGLAGLWPILHLLLIEVATLYVF